MQRLKNNPCHICNPEAEKNKNRKNKTIKISQSLLIEAINAKVNFFKFLNLFIVFKNFKILKAFNPVNPVKLDCLFPTILSNKKENIPIITTNKSSQFQ